MPAAAQQQDDDTTTSVAVTMTGTVAFVMVEAGAAAERDGLGVATEAERCVRSLAAALQQHGSSTAQLVRVNCYLGADEYRQEFWRTWDRLFAEVPVKPMRLTHVTPLAAGGRVALDAVALITEERVHD